MRPVFVGGTGRSGTTVVRRLLAAAPGVVALPEPMEPRLVIDPDGLLDLALAFRDWTPFRADIAVHRFGVLARNIQGPSKRAELGVAAYDRWVEGVLDDAVCDVGRTFWPHLHMRSRHGFYETAPGLDVRPHADAFFRLAGDGDVWVDDTPESVLRWREVRSVWPGAAFVIAQRDPMDVAASMGGMRADKFWASDPYLMGARIGRVTRRLADVPALRLSVEGMTANPRGTVRALSEHCGVAIPAEAADLIDPRAANVGRWRDMPEDFNDAVRRGLDHAA